jgi:hypothetical protein
MAKKSNAIATISQDEEWKVESDLRCLTEARAIRKDPKRMAKVRTLAKQRLGEVAELASDGESGDDC